MATIQIGPLRYDVQVVDQINESDCEERITIGDIIFSTGVIRVLNMPTIEQRKVTLWHEILHAVMRQAGWNRLKEEEQVIEAISHGIVDLIERNGLDALYATIVEQD